MAKFDVNPQDIDWQGKDSVFLHNPKLQEKEKELLAQLRPELPDIDSCVWILTSGSTVVNRYKWIALKKEAFLASARSVNKHIQSDSNDIWLNVLPNFHVGGLAVWARAHLSQAKVIEYVEAWSPHQFIHVLESNKVTLTSLVPTQVYDLVHSELKCPKNLRVIFVGGGALSEELYLKARDLGYPLLPTYGMTETCSQIATARLDSLKEYAYPEAQVLNHLEMQKSPEDILEVKGSSLLCGIAYIENRKLRFEEHAENTWYSTDDVGDISQGCVKVRGRRSELVKVLGELVSFPKLRSVLNLISHGAEATLIPIPDERKGHSVALVFEMDSLDSSYLEIVTDFNERVAAFEKATEVYFVDKIPKSPLGKLKSGKLKEILGVV